MTTWHSGLMPRPPLIIVVGPTAVGKSDFAISLAERIRGEIVSADSRLFYRGMSIGTAKPSVSDRRRVPHHLIDVADPDQSLSLTEFQRMALAAIGEVHSRGHFPLLVGGTGQYVRAVTRGWEPPQVQPDPHLRAVLEALNRRVGGEVLHRRLSAMDPAAAASIDPRNHRRTIRALEVIFKTGRPLSQQRGSGETPFDLLTLGLKRPRPDLYARLDQRIESMFALGFLDEVRDLLARGYTLEMPAMSAIGYRQCVEVLRGERNLEEAKAEIKRLTRVFVRRQANWFRETDPAIKWFDAADPGLVEAAESYVRRFLSLQPEPR